VTTLNRSSTAFARWWCHSGRHTRLGRMITATAAWRAEAQQPATNGEAVGACTLHAPTVSMAARRAAVDAVLATNDEAP
jgi:hypothetical protein